MALFGFGPSASSLNTSRFTERLRMTLARARDEAAQFGHEYIGTEHLVLALLGDGSGVVVAVLDALHADRQRIRDMITGIVKRGPATNAVHAELPLTSRTKHVLELAADEARELGHSYVGAEHLLIGVLRETKGIGAQTLAEVGLTLDAVRATTLRLLGTQIAALDSDVAEETA